MTDINEDVPTETETLNNETETLNNETDILENETETLNNETERDFVPEALRAEQPTKPKPKHIPPINKKRERLPPAKLSTVERNKILYDYDRGVYDPVWEVVITKTNKKIVRRRKIPLTQPETNISHESVVNNSSPQTQTPQPTQPPTQPPTKDWMSSIQYYNVQNSFNEQLMKQIDELNNKITHQNNKHKKLKTKYKKLKRSIFSDDSDDEPNPSPININDHETNINDHETNINESINEYEEVTPIPKRKLNLRDTIDFTKYGFSPI